MIGRNGLINFFISYIIVLFLSCAYCLAENEKKIPEESKQLIVYCDKDYPENHYYPTEWIGDVQDLDLDEGWETDSHSGSTCIKIRYKASGDFGWAGILWVNPKGNWGNEKGGFDLRFAKQLSFWAKGEKGGEYIAVFRFGGIKGVYSDSDIHGLGPLTLTNEWKQYIIDVSKRNMRYISTGFGFAITKAHNRQGCIFYIDDIKYE